MLLGELPTTLGQRCPRPLDTEVREGNVFSSFRAFNHLEHRTCVDVLSV